jgi:hypothetical protein
VSGYKTQGVDADAKDFSAGMGMVVRLPEIKRMRAGGFFQTQYANSNIAASYPDGQGGMVAYGQSDHDCLMTGGLDFEVRISRHTSMILRPGRNFRGGLAASQGGGFYFASGIVVDPFRLFTKFRV